MTGPLGERGNPRPVVIARTAVVLDTALVLQVSLVGDLGIAGASGDLMLVVAIAAGIAGGPDRGAGVGFSSGLLYDLILPTPFGLSALVYGVVGYAVGTLHGGVFGTIWWLPPVTTAVAAAAGVAMFAVVGAVLGEHGWVTTHLLTIMGVVAVVGALASPVAVRSMLWTTGEGREAGFLDRLGRLVRRRVGPRERPSTRWATVVDLPVGEVGAAR